MDNSSLPFFSILKVFPGSSLSSSLSKMLKSRSSVTHLRVQAQAKQLKNIYSLLSKSDSTLLTTILSNIVVIFLYKFIHFRRVKITIHISMWITTSIRYLYKKTYSLCLRLDFHDCNELILMILASKPTY